jgi:branched-chain amino acid aminotransferase
MAEEAQGPGFGRVFAAHMLTQRYHDGAWEKAKLVKYSPFKLSPATVVFHYGQEIFEGFKAYRQPDGSVCLFRPDKNLSRLNTSAARLCMPAIDVPAVIADIGRLIKKNKAQIPTPPQTFYMRPCMIGTDEIIKVSPSSSYLFFVIVSIVSEYFGGNNPCGVRLRTETEFVRAARGGTGFTKCGGNYAGSLAAQGQSAKEGFDQVVWLDADEHKYIEEMGGMNIMFVIGGKLVTPPISAGTILPGVTRDSLLQLAEARGVPVEERAISTDELKTAFQAGNLQEAFACGTAAVITPIREIVHRGEVIYRNDSGQPGALTSQLRKQLVDLQFGLAPDPFNWRLKVKC